MKNWTDIPGYEGYYQIHPTEGFKSLDRIVNAYGGGKVVIKGKLLSQSLGKEGYYKIGLCKNNKLKNIRIHILLARVFIPNPNNYPFVRHLNDIKTDNRLENLAWGTPKDNAQDSIRNGTFKFIPGGVTHHWYGRTSAPPNKGMKGINANNNKYILDTQTGVFYYGTQDAANAKCINASTLRCKLSGHYINNTGLIYV